MEVSQAKKTKPRFLLTNWLPLSFNRYDGEYVRGKWVENVEATFSVNANVQPLKFTELMILPESERTRDWIKVYVALDEETVLPRIAKEGSNGWKSDRFVWQGEEYEVIRERRYKMGVLDHAHYLCARVPISAL